jgi:hypothetical protein
LKVRFESLHHAHHRAWSGLSSHRPPTGF